MVTFLRRRNGNTRLGLGMRTRIVEVGPSWYPRLGDCPCGHGSIRRVTRDGSIEFFECGIKTLESPACRKRFHPRGGDAGHYLCATDDNPTLHDFGAIVVEQDVQSFESHLKGDDASPRGITL